MLQAGERVPDFDLKSDTAGEVKSAELIGKRYVLYFYPKDDTSGCTMEACSFRDNLPDFSSLDVPVFGISPDDVTSHQKFRAKFGLTFPLLADAEHKTTEAFGAWVEKNMYGRTYMGVQRSTFIIGPDGRIEHVWPKVNPADHAKEVLAYLRVEPAADQSAPLPLLEQAPAVPMEEIPMTTTETQIPVETNPPMTEPPVMEIPPTPEPTPVPAPQPAAKKATKKTAAKKVAAKKAAKKVTKKTAAKKTAAKKGAAKKASKKTATKKSTAKKATKKTASKKVAARKGGR